MMMKGRLKKLPAAVSGALTLGLVATFVATAASAQTPAPQKIEKIEVTGSNIKRIDAETTAPVQVITRAEIESSGKQTVTELLRTLPTNAGGGLNDITGSNSFSSGASTISLRGLGSAATLVLLNGRRIAPFGNADPNFGQSGVVNLDALPLDVIERIEILKDGASAIYGSEAIAGVVNIILRKDFTGALINGSFTMNRDSEYKTSRASTTLGYGDLARDRFNVFINYEHLHRDVATVDDVQNYVVPGVMRDSATYQTLRRFTSSYADNYLAGVFNTATGQATATAFLPAASQPANCVPGAVKISGICRWDIPAKQDIVPRSDRDNFFSRGSVDFSGTLSGFAEVGFNRTKTFYRGNPQVSGDFGQWYSSSQKKLVNMQEYLPVGHPNNPFTTRVILRHRFVEVGDGNREATSEATRGVVGVKGIWGTIDWESGLLYTKNDNTTIQQNQIRLSKLNEGIINGTYNFLNPTAGTLKPADLRINTEDRSKSSFMIYDLKASKEIGSLPAGPVSVAAGYEYRKEDRTATPDANKVTGEVVGFGAALANGARNVNSLYAELSLPLLRDVETQLAFRTDRYSDYGNSTTPKVGIKWKATPSLAFRGSMAEGFRAPSLTEISRSSVTAFTTITDPKRCITGAELDCLRSVALLLENADRLEPEKAKTYNVGMVWEPAKDLSMTLDYFHIHRRNEITILDLDTILQNEDATTGVYAGRVIRGLPIPGETVGQLQAISTFFFNSGSTIIKGYDLDVKWNTSIGAWGKLRNTLAGTYYKSYQGNSSDAEPLTQIAGYGFPRARGSARVEWEYRDFITGLQANWSKDYNVLRDPSLTCTAAIKAVTPTCQVKSNTTLDLSIRYTGIKKLTIDFIARNIMDRRAPLDANARPVNFTYHPFQSVLMTLAATYRFK